MRCTDFLGHSNIEARFRQVVQSRVSQDVGGKVGGRSSTTRLAKMRNVSRISQERSLSYKPTDA